MYYNQFVINIIIINVTVININTKFEIIYLYFENYSHCTKRTLNILLIVQYCVRGTYICFYPQLVHVLHPGYLGAVRR